MNDKKPEDQKREDIVSAKPKRVSRKPSKAEVEKELTLLKAQQVETFQLKQIEMIRKGIFHTIEGLTGFMLTKAHPELITGFDMSFMELANKHAASFVKYAAEVNCALALSLVILDAYKVTKTEKLKKSKEKQNGQRK